MALGKDGKDMKRHDWCCDFQEIVARARRLIINAKAGDLFWTRTGFLFSCEFSRCILQGTKQFVLGSDFHEPLSGAQLSGGFESVNFPVALIGKPAG